MSLLFNPFSFKAMRDAREEAVAPKFFYAYKSESGGHLNSYFTNKPSIILSIPAIKGAPCPLFLILYSLIKKKMILIYTKCNPGKSFLIFKA